jgi:hypothetical protein
MDPAVAGPLPESQWIRRWPGLIDKFCRKTMFVGCDARTSAAFSSNRRKGGALKILLLVAGLFLTVSATSEAGLPGRGFHGGSIGRGARPASIHGGFSGGGFRGRLVDRRAGAPFRTGQRIRRGFAGRRFFSGNPVVFYQPYGWPGYWDPYDDQSYLEPDSGSDYQYWDNSAPSVQPQPSNRMVDQRPVVIVMNNPGNSRLIEQGSNPGYVNSGYIRHDAGEQPGLVVQDPNDRTDPPPSPAPVVPPATPATQNTQASLQPGPGVFGKFVVVGWLQDGGKDVVSIKNIETNDVQRITSQPNIDHLRLVEVHPNPDPRQFEAIISNGSDQGPVRFRF